METSAADLAARARGVEFFVVTFTHEGVRNFVFVGCTLLFEGGTTYGNQFQCD
jgi:hypothetical protein